MAGSARLRQVRSQAHCAATRSSGIAEQRIRAIACGLEGDRELVGSCGQAAPLLEAVEAPLDGVPLLVDLAVEAGRTATEPASPQAVADVVGRLRDDRTDTPAPQVAADGAGGIRAVGQNGQGRVRGLPGPLRGTRMRDITVSKAGASPAWPAVTVKARGRARPSAARWTLVLSPPRERPSA
ncbi:hypothetical protein GCM10010256_46170 [Streptomyces coeruleorubidus]|nr:hypothetical protein GCM10010256_46170 [Streptomyces coeruleorubidus]